MCVKFMFNSLSLDIVIVKGRDPDLQRWFLDSSLLNVIPLWILETNLSSLYGFFSKRMKTLRFHVEVILS